MTKERAADLPPRLYSLAEVEEVAHVTRRTLYMWIEDDYLKAVKVGGRWRVPREELDELISGRKGAYKRRVYKEGKPVGFTLAARERKAREAAARQELDAGNTDAPESSMSANSKNRT